MSKTNTIKQALQESPSGLTLKEISVLLESDEKRASGMLSYVNKKYRCITHNGEKYFFKGSKSVVSLPASDQRVPSNVVDLLSMGQANLKRLAESLPNGDLKDFRDMVKKSAFYGMTALSLVRANKMADEVCGASI